MLCIISIQYPCRYDRILPLAIHHPELAEVGLGRARVLRLPVGRVTRDTWHYTRDIIHVWHVTLYTCDTCCPRYNEWRCPRAFHSHGVDCILQSQVCDGDKDCQDNVRTRAANDPSAKFAALFCHYSHSCHFESVSVQGDEKNCTYCTPGRAFLCEEQIEYRVINKYASLIIKMRHLTYAYVPVHPSSREMWRVLGLFRVQQQWWEGLGPVNEISRMCL